MSYVWKLYLNLALGCIDIVILLYPKPKCLNKTQNGYKWFFGVVLLLLQPRIWNCFFFIFEKEQHDYLKFCSSYMLYDSSIQNPCSSTISYRIFCSSILLFFFYRRLSKSQVHFHHGTCTRGVFKTQLNIYDRAFLQK